MTARYALQKRCHTPRRSQRAFTLVELLVALLAGMIVTMGAFALARASTNAFQQEARAASATVAATVGFRRLVADVQRASFLSSPNVQRDFVSAQTGSPVPGAVCLQPTSALFPPGIVSLAGLRVDAYGSYPTTGTVAPPNDANALAPDRIVLAGSFATTEQFYVRDAVNTGLGVVVQLQSNSGAFVRTQSRAPSGTLNPPAGGADPVWGPIFSPGRILRIVDQQGFQHFGIIASVDTLGGTVNVHLSTTNAPLYLQGATPPAVQINPSCVGIAGFGIGSLANVVNRIVYEVRDLAGVAAYASLYAPAGGTPIEDRAGSRFELVRYEIDANDALIPGTEELVAEYAVDLRVGATIDIRPQGVQTPQLVRYAFGNASVYNYAQKVADGNVAPGPERIRDAIVRLTVRSRQADRGANGNLPPGITRYLVPNAVGSNTYARTRTLRAEVSLPNQVGVFW